MTTTPDITSSELLIILDVTRHLAEQRMVQPLVEYVAANVFEFIPAERCLIVLFGESDELQVAIARDRAGQPIADVDDQISSSILQQVRANLTPVFVNNALEDRVFKTAQSVRSLGLRSVMCVPLVSRGQAIGAIYVENRSVRARFRESNLIPLMLFANQVVVALANARVYEELEATVALRTQALQEANALLERQAAELHELSIRDSLTGLYNRRHFSDLLPQVFDLTLRYQRPLALACADIDNFKQINDTFFHSGGDRVLITLAQILRDGTRQADTIARIGGEEFVLVMPETPLAAAIQSCERLRASVEQYDWDTVAPGLRVTLSIGVAIADGHASAQDLLREADARLYAAKRAGKNQVVAQA